jgi:hypothetical protein
MSAEWQSVHPATSVCPPLLSRGQAWAAAKNTPCGRANSHAELGHASGALAASVRPGRSSNGAPGELIASDRAQHPRQCRRCPPRPPVASCPDVGARGPVAWPAWRIAHKTWAPAVRTPCKQPLPRESAAAALQMAFMLRRPVGGAPPPISDITQPCRRTRARRRCSKRSDVRHEGQRRPRSRRTHTPGCAARPCASARASRLARRGRPSPSLRRSSARRLFLP